MLGAAFQYQDRACGSSSFLHHWKINVQGMGVHYGQGIKDSQLSPQGSRLQFHLTNNVL